MELVHNKIKLKGIIYFIFVLMMIFTSCIIPTKRSSIRKFNKHKEEILSFQEKWMDNELITDNKMRINTFHQGSIGIHFNFISTETIVFWFCKKKIDYKYYSLTDTLLNNFPETIQKLETLVKSEKFRKDLKTLIETGVKGVKFTEDYFFITYGSGASHPDYVGGIHINNRRLDSDYDNHAKYSKNYIDTGIVYSQDRL